MKKDLVDVPGREMLMLTVEYPPGAVEHIHRHDASAFVYVLEGSIVEGVRGGKEVTLAPRVPDGLTIAPFLSESAAQRGAGGISYRIMDRSSG